MNRNEINKLKGLMNEDVYDLLKHSGAIIAGGAITSLFTNKEVNDIDVYLPSQRAVVDVIASAMNEEEFTSYGTIGIGKMFFSNMSNKSVLFVDSVTRTKIQLITFKYFNTPEEIFETFDFTCCMGAFVMETEEFVFHPDFFKHCSQRYLKFNPNTSFPLVSALRVNKYKDKGFYISKSEYLRVVLSCMDLKIDSWEEFKEHIGGMYGYDMDEVFEEEKEFSLSEAMEQLGNLYVDDKFEYQHANLTFEQVLEKFDSAEEFEIPPPPFKEGYYYKHVTDQMESVYSYGSSKIKYEVGSVVNGGQNGIYVHANPLKPHLRHSICIELKPVGQCVVYSVPTYGDESELRITGDLEVVRIVPEYFNDPPYMMKYRYDQNKAS